MLAFQVLPSWVGLATGPCTRAELPTHRLRDQLPPVPCHDDGDEMPVEIVGRDEELGALDGFLGREAAPRLAALVLEGEAGIGKSTLWLAGVELARERGLRVLSSRPAEVELGVAHAGLGDLLEDALGEVLADLPRSAPARARGRAARA